VRSSAPFFFYFLFSSGSGGGKSRNGHECPATASVTITINVGATHSKTSAQVESQSQSICAEKWCWKNTVEVPRLLRFMRSGCDGSKFAVQDSNWSFKLCSFSLLFRCVCLCVCACDRRVWECAFSTPGARAWKSKTRFWCRDWIRFESHPPPGVTCFRKQGFLGTAVCAFLSSFFLFRIYVINTRFPHTHSHTHTHTHTSDTCALSPKLYPSRKALAWLCRSFLSSLSFCRSTFIVICVLFSAFLDLTVIDWRWTEADDEIPPKGVERRRGKQENEFLIQRHSFEVFLRQYLCMYICMYVIHNECVTAIRSFLFESESAALNFIPAPYVYSITSI